MTLAMARATFGQPAVSKPALPKITETPIPLLTPYQLGPFKLSHRYLTNLQNVAQEHWLCWRRSPRHDHTAMYLKDTPLFTTPNARPRAASSSRKQLLCPRLAIGYPSVPGIWTQEQTEAWKPIVQAVHDKGDIFFCQIWHSGRFSHTSFQPNGAPPPSPTNQRIKNYGQMYLQDGSTADISQPRAIETHEIPLFVEAFVQAARNAVEAGFDGVELHAANGYLIDQFLRDSANDRTDEYGGSVENRCRCLLEIVKGVGNAIGLERVGVRISPFTDVLDATDSNPGALAVHLTGALSLQKIRYLHIIEPRLDGEETPSEDVILPVRRAYKGSFMAGGGYNRTTGNQAIASGKADLMSFGRLFLANPDLPKLFALNAPLNKHDRNTFYTHDPVIGYTDYPTLEDVVETQA